MIVNPHYGYCIVASAQEMSGEITHDDAFALPDNSLSVT